VNEKNVTDLAVHAANAVLYNADYYHAQLEEDRYRVEWLDENLKHYTKDLQRCQVAAPMIYDYNLKSGNFFLIYARDTKQVCSVFKEHGTQVFDVIII
jgi:Flp pilus assembly secretin CpaC